MLLLQRSLEEIMLGRNRFLVSSHQAVMQLVVRDTGGVIDLRLAVVCNVTQ